MKATELRIGNLVYYKIVDKLDERKEWFEPCEIDAVDLQVIDSDYQPMPLTEEWLLNFGFESDGIEWWNGILSIGICKEGLRYLPTEQINVRVGIVLQYVHQLQNLYFALTNEELTLIK